MIKIFRKLLFPFSVLYGFGLSIRNGLYDRKILSSASFDLPVICIGNLSVGGTGKTPMVELIIDMLQPKYTVATLSRGYRRGSKGFIVATNETTAEAIGDEPMQVHVKYPDITVAVAEKRVRGISNILKEFPATDVILLDDAFQHRAVTAGLNILLSECDQLFTRDLLLPAGTLRDKASSSKRADIIVVTKCDPGITGKKRELIIKEINPSPRQSVFFTTLEYSTPYHIYSRQPQPVCSDAGILLVSGIANPEPMRKSIANVTNQFDVLTFSDHHTYTADDIDRIKKSFKKMNFAKTMILTTEKDAVKLLRFKEEFAGLPVYAWPVKHKFLFQQEEEFRDQVCDFVSGSRK